jgi:hypothetical protein
MEISQTADKNAPRVVVETPVDSEFRTAIRGLRARAWKSAGCHSLGDSSRDCPNYVIAVGSTGRNIRTPVGVALAEAQQEKVALFVR